MKSRELGSVAPRSLSPVFPTGSYSYSHGLEFAVESKRVHDRESLVDWLEADLHYGSPHNDALFFVEAWRCAAGDDHARLLEISELSAAFRGTAEFALETSQQGASCLATLRDVWPDPVSEWLSQELRVRGLPAVLPVVVAVRCAAQGVPADVALRAYLQAFVGNL